MGERMNILNWDGVSQEVGKISQRGPGELNSYSRTYRSVERSYDEQVEDIVYRGSSNDVEVITGVRRWIKPKVAPVTKDRTDDGGDDYPDFRRRNSDHTEH